MSLREKILAAAGKFQPVAVECGHLGGTVYVRPMTLGGMQRFLAAVEGEKHRTSVLMLTECLCEADGKRLFTKEDEPALLDLPSNVANELVEAISRASGLEPKAEAMAAGN